MEFAIVRKSYYIIEYHIWPFFLGGGGGVSYSPTVPLQISFTCNMLATSYRLLSASEQYETGYLSSAAKFDKPLLYRPEMPMQFDIKCSRKIAPIIQLSVFHSSPKDIRFHNKSIATGEFCGHFKELFNTKQRNGCRL